MMHIFSIILIFSFFSFMLGIILSFISDKFKSKKNPIIEKINECLPQSQCGQCGYSSCNLYSEAISNVSEKIDKCTPGGDEVILKLSNILNIDVPVKKKCETDKKILHEVVWIDEKNCVGCSKCAIFCPVDAIVGAPNFMHTVLQEFCTGCNICILHCPTNCIHTKINKKLHENRKI